MQRRTFLKVSVLAPAAAAIHGLGTTAGLASAEQVRNPIEIAPSVLPAMPERLAGMSLEQLLADYRRRLFDQYLPFWDKGGYDRQFGGFLCELEDDGSVASPEKFIWYQGRAVWVYSFLFNEFGRDGRWLEVARRTRDFMVKHFYAGQGKWYEKVHRDGRLIEGLGKNVFGWLFPAVGLAEYFLATGREEDFDLARQSILAAMRAYDDPAYCDTHTVQYTGLDIAPQGLRSQGHSMVLVGALTRLLARHAEPRLEELAQQHVDLLLDKFWNADYGIQNEFLTHDYRRLPAAAQHMFTGHSVETLWLVMHEVLRRKDRARFDRCKARIRRLLEMTWDYVFEGLGDGNYLVFGTEKQPRGPQFEVKTMWAHCEAMVACLSILEYSAEAWAREWYERLRAYTLRTMPKPEHGVWRQAVDRFGKDLKRVGVSTKRKDNYHQARYQMLDILSLQRMLVHGGRATPFPS